MLQELAEDSPNGLIPRSTKTVFMDDLADTVKPGDKV